MHNFKISENLSKYINQIQAVHSHSITKRQYLLQLSLEMSFITKTFDWLIKVTNRNDSTQRHTFQTQVL